MQSFNDDERKQALGEVLADELKVISEYAKDVPAIQREVHQMNAKVDDISERLNVIEHVLKDHEAEIKSLKRKAA